MCISEVLAELEKLLSKYGDLAVYRLGEKVPDDVNDRVPVELIGTYIEGNERRVEID
jgi:hypothetical protein